MIHMLALPMAPTEFDKDLTNRFGQEVLAQMREGEVIKTNNCDQDTQLLAINLRISHIVYKLDENGFCIRTLYLEKF